MSDSTVEQGGTIIRKFAYAINKVILFLLTALICQIGVLSSPLFARTEIYDNSGRLEVSKEYPLPEESRATQRRIHPSEAYFRSRKVVREEIRSDNFNRLLVLLVDFQEDNDPRTTGNGKFMLEPDPEYPVSLDAPPHDYEFFTAHMEALKYYYLAASLGNYELDYDIYPRENDPKFAYTLPNQMAYYNPGMDNQELFIERIEEYFRDIFTIADSDGEIDFAQYAHFMIIHAGSDWQHDVYGDTPSDIPSFFIQIGDGKEVWVNDGTVKISHACNVPETISQDERYGVINAVVAHEFGHSLGFVDLYNVNNFSPAVGYWDIMDSGGAGRLSLQGYDGEWYALEGGLPALPGAWHRLLVWGDELKDMGVYKQINDFPVGEEIPLTAASSLFDSDNPLPYFVRVPLNATEYLLLENRHVDPDGDGGIAFRGAAPITPGQSDYRVLLHPIEVYDDDEMSPIYEYDWLLPGWLNSQGESFGGGVIAWHIDEQIIFNEGVIDSEGNFRSNYDNNSINTVRSRRGIRIIEADNIDDIGNPYSWYWYGTEYEPYYRYKPVLDSEGYFLRWSPEVFNRELSSISKPPLLTNSGYPSIYRIYDISSSAGRMSLKYTFEPFIHTGVLSNDLVITHLAKPAATTFIFPALTELPVFTEGGVVFYRHLYDTMMGYDDWNEASDIFEFPYVPTQPLISHVQQGYPTEHYVTSGDKVIRISENRGSFEQILVELGSEVVESPILYERDQETLLFIPTTEGIKIWNEDEGILAEFLFDNARIAFNGNDLFAAARDKLVHIPLVTVHKEEKSREEVAVYDLPGLTGCYYPVYYNDEENYFHNALFIQDDEGNLYKLRNQSLNRIFSPAQYTEAKPTQLALAQVEDQVNIFFAAGEYLFALDLYGNLERGYPHYIENRHIAGNRDLRVIELEGETVLLLPVEDEGYLFYEFAGGFLPEYSVVWDRPTSLLEDLADYSDHLYWEEISGRLYYFFTDSNNYLYENIISSTDFNPIIWNGFRHNNWNMYSGIHRVDTTPQEQVKAYAFPNPARAGEVRIRVEGAEEKIELQLYDISGKRLFTRVYDDNIGSVHDILWNTGNIATGVYFGIIRTNGRKVDFKVAIEK